MLSLTCKTAIKAVIYLGSRPEPRENAGIKEIAKYIGASEHTVGKILQTLVKEDVINSIKGPAGGFNISTAQLRKNIMTIVVAVDGKEVFKECGLGLSKCSASHPCPIHDEYKIGRDLIEKLFIRKKISDLCDPVNNGLAYLFG
jgi:Rrf2 family protein